MGEKKPTYKEESGRTNYTAIVRSADFQKLLQVKRRFIIPSTVFFLVFYFTLPLMTSYSTVLNHSFYGNITWAWVFAFAQFIMTWALCMIYSKKAGQFDHLTERILQMKKGGTSK